MISQEEYIKNLFEDMRMAMRQELPPGREQSLCLTDIDRAELMALKAIGAI